MSETVTRFLNKRYGSMHREQGCFQGGPSLGKAWLRIFHNQLPPNFLSQLQNHDKGWKEAPVHQ